MDAVNDLLILIDSYLGSAVWFPFLLLSVGIFFTLYLGFPQIRYFKHAIGITTGRFDKDGAKGDTSHFQALATALSGTVGTGNIGGVALALHLGGPAALFWMWVTAFFGMTSKFVEVTLSHKYREQTADGTMAGGPMYYMEKGMNAKWLAIIFAMATVLSSFGTGSLPQINSIAAGLQSTFDIEPIVTGAVLSVLLALVIIGGIKRIAAVAAAIVPTMAIIYIVGAFAVILPILAISVLRSQRSLVTRSPVLQRPAVSLVQPLPMCSTGALTAACTLTRQVKAQLLSLTPLLALMSLLTRAWCLFWSPS